MSTLFDTYPKEQQGQGKANVTAVGHYSPYINYDLNTLDKKRGTNEVSFAASIDRIVKLKEKRRRVSVNSSREDLTFGFTHSELMPRMTNCVPNDPVFVVSVDPILIPDHNTISNGSFVRTLEEFLSTFSNEDQ